MKILPRSIAIFLILTPMIASAEIPFSTAKSMLENGLMNDTQAYEAIKDSMAKQLAEMMKNEEFARQLDTAFAAPAEDTAKATNGSDKQHPVQEGFLLQALSASAETTRSVNMAKIFHHVDLNTLSSQDAVPMAQMAGAMQMLNTAYIHKMEIHPAFATKGVFMLNKVDNGSVGNLQTFSSGKAQIGSFIGDELVAYDIDGDMYVYTEEKLPTTPVYVFGADEGLIAASLSAYMNEVHNDPETFALMDYEEYLDYYNHQLQTLGEVKNRSWGLTDAECRTGPCVVPYAVECVGTTGETGLRNVDGQEWVLMVYALLNKATASLKKTMIKMRAVDLPNAKGNCGQVASDGRGFPKTFWKLGPKKTGIPLFKWDEVLAVFNVDANQFSAKQSLKYAAGLTLVEIDEGNLAEGLAKNAFSSTFKATLKFIKKFKSVLPPEQREIVEALESIADEAIKEYRSAESAGQKQIARKKFWDAMSQQIDMVYPSVEKATERPNPAQELFAEMTASAAQGFLPNALDWLTGMKDDHVADFNIPFAVRVKNENGEAIRMGIDDRNGPAKYWMPYYGYTNINGQRKVNAYLWICDTTNRDPYVCLDKAF